MEYEEDMRPEKRNMPNYLSEWSGYVSDKNMDYITDRNTDYNSDKYVEYNYMNNINNNGPYIQTMSNKKDTYKNKTGPIEDNYRNKSVQPQYGKFINDYPFQYIDIINDDNEEDEYNSVSLNELEDRTHAIIILY